MPRKSWIGGNFKSAATQATVLAQVKLLNDAGALPANAEVVIAPSALHIGLAKQALRADVGVAIQNIHTAKVRRTPWLPSLLSPPSPPPPPPNRAPPPSP